LRSALNIENNYFTFCMKSILILAFSIVSALAAGQTITLSGTIIDAKTGESLISASVYNPETLKGTTTNLYGFYSLQLPMGKVKMAVSYTGYQTVQLELTIRRDTIINVALESMNQLSEVTVGASLANQKVESTQMGAIQLTPMQANKIPVLLVVRS
jgi:hypothetical protein